MPSAPRPRRMPRATAARGRGRGGTTQARPQRSARHSKNARSRRAASASEPSAPAECAAVARAHSMSVAVDRSGMGVGWAASGRLCDRPAGEAVGRRLAVAARRPGGSCRQPLCSLWSPLRASPYPPGRGWALHRSQSPRPPMREDGGGGCPARAGRLQAWCAVESRTRQKCQGGGEARPVDGWPPPPPPHRPSVGSGRRGRNSCLCFASFRAARTPHTSTTATSPQQHGCSSPPWAAEQAGRMEARARQWCR